ncbi:alpha/beta hydrolase [Povalibacter sp.]|uniref:alpha/beta hydrolase n=1 Tax=Povalibacter sp. TaxID=1962978 RepID=UPI002F3FCB49
MSAVFQEDRSVLTRAARPPDYSVRYGADPENIADVWQGAAPIRPLIVMIHGGFWRPEYDRTHTAPMCAAIADAGWTVATIEYRRSPGHPDLTCDDVNAAIADVPAQVRHHDGRVIVMGHSAGGHLCLYSAATPTHRSLIGALALAPAADLQLIDSLNLDGGAARDFLGATATDRPDLDPARMPDSATPTIMLHGREDAIVPLAVSQAYVAKHPSARLHVLDGCGHFALIDPQSDAWRSVIAELERLTG